MLSTAVNLPWLRFDPTREEVSDFNGEVYAVRRLNLSQGLVRQALHFGPQRHIKRPSSQMCQISEIHRIIDINWWTRPFVQHFLGTPNGMFTLHGTGTKSETGNGAKEQWSYYNILCRTVHTAPGVGLGVGSGKRTWKQWVAMYYAELSIQHREGDRDQTHCLLLVQRERAIKWTSGFSSTSKLTLQQWLNLILKYVWM